MPHVWDNAPRWSRAEATAHFIHIKQIEQWSALTDEERKTMLSRVPRVSNA